MTIGNTSHLCPNCSGDLSMYSSPKGCLSVCPKCGFAISSGFFDPYMIKNYTPKRILVNGRAVIVFWEDNTKTVIKLADGDTDDIYTAYCIALAKKFYKSNSQIKTIIKRTIDWGDS